MTASTLDLRQQLRLPLVAAPMFLLSGPALVTAAIRCGIVGALPALNARTSHDLDTWLADINAVRSASASEGKQVGLPALNIITHPSNDRFAADLDVCINHRVPLVVSAVGSPARLVDPVHRYGGAVFADVSSVLHARKAAAAGVDGLILLCSGAGGNTGRLSPFAFVEEVRKFFDGPVGVAGAVGNGAALRALEVLGADFGYAGTAFIATTESQADDAYRAMVVEAGADDIEQSSAVSGIAANFLRKSLDRIRHRLAGTPGSFDIAQEQDNLKRWRDIWSAGHGVGAVSAIEATAAVVDRMELEYRRAGGTGGWAHR
ncbi:NAD(P)H-dependent flavin oxidoreductase [Xenophilus aerolatus]|nr:nitronate monooxygenase [Xenophilus aerolatus]